MPDYRRRNSNSGIKRQHSVSQKKTLKRSDDNSYIDDITNQLFLQNLTPKANVKEKSGEFDINTQVPFRSSPNFMGTKDLHQCEQTSDRLPPQLPHLPKKKYSQINSYSK